MAHPDLDKILNMLLAFAQRMLTKHGEFHPFAASMNNDGHVAPVGGYTGDEHPASQEVIDLLVDGLRQRANQGEIKAAGICLDVRIIPPGETEKVDAICAQLEHENGEAADVYLPYKKGWLGRVRYGELFAAKRELSLFHVQDNK